MSDATKPGFVEDSVIYSGACKFVNTLKCSVYLHTYGIICKQVLNVDKEEYLVIYLLIKIIKYYIPESEYLKNMDLSKSDLHNTYLWKCIMAQTTEDHRKSVDALQIEKSYKLSLTNLDNNNPHQTDVYRWMKFKATVTLLKTGLPTKMTLKLRCVTCHEGIQGKF